MSFIAKVKIMLAKVSLRFNYFKNRMALVPSQGITLKNLALSYDVFQSIQKKCSPLVFGDDLQQ